MGPMQVSGTGMGLENTRRKVLHTEGAGKGGGSAGRHCHLEEGSALWRWQCLSSCEWWDLDRGREGHARKGRA